MEEFKGTPGEWQIIGKDIVATNHPVCEITKGKWGDRYASLECVNGTLIGEYKAFIDMIEYGEVPTEEAEANARLIAAAPELLQALQLLLYGWNNSDLQHDVTAAFNQAQGAVNKALGI